MFSFTASAAADGDFICFIGELTQEMGGARHVTEIPPPLPTAPAAPTATGARVGMMCLSLHSVPTLSICCRVPSKPLCRFYSLELTKDILKEHMEEDLELFSDKGLEGFGKILGAALKKPVVAVVGSNSDEAKCFPLQLTYSIGDNELTGVLEIPLIEENISEGVLNFMFDIKESSVATVSVESSSVGKKRSHDDITSLTQSQGDDNSSDATQQQPSDTSTPSMVAKPKHKKRVGGISLNPSSRKKR